MEAHPAAGLAEADWGKATGKSYEDKTFPHLVWPPKGCALCCHCSHSLIGCSGNGVLDFKTIRSQVRHTPVQGCVTSKFSRAVEHHRVSRAVGGLASCNQVNGPGGLILPVPATWFRCGPLSAQLPVTLFIPTADVRRSLIEEGPYLKYRDYATVKHPDLCISDLIDQGFYRIVAPRLYGNNMTNVYAKSGLDRSRKHHWIVGEERHLTRLATDCVALFWVPNQGLALVVAQA